MPKCLICKFECNNLLEHVKSDWHTYNLRRDTVGLRVITFEDFRAKQNDLISKNTIELLKDYYCCNKTFKSVKTYENHLKSKKHIEKPKNEEEETESDEEIDEEEMIVEYNNNSESEEEERVIQPLTCVDCFFCHVSSETPDINLQHMSKKHNFNLPYRDFINDLDGLMEYLVSLVDEYNVCFECNKQFDDRRSVRNHMRDKNHMQLYFHLESNGDDLGPFYGEIPKPMSNLIDKSMDNDMQVEAVLPSGKTIGHRSSNIYFKQNLNGLSNTEKLAITSGVDKAKMCLVKSGRCGQLTAAGAPVLTPQHKKSQTLEARNRQLRESRFSNYQSHFRLQILM